MTRTLFAGGTVFDGSGAAPAAADMVVEDGRIVDMGTGLDGDERIDLAGRASSARSRSARASIATVSVWWADPG